MNRLFLLLTAGLFILLLSLHPEKAKASAPPTPPNAPSNLTAQSISSSQINLSWTDNSSNESRFYIERSPTGTGSWTVLGYVNANVTTYSSTGLSAGTRYYYQVRAWNSGGYSGYTNVANNWTRPATPTLSASVISSSQINLSWTNVAGESGYYLQRSPNGSTGWETIYSPGADVTSYPNTGLSPGTHYWYRVYAWNSGGNSGYSNDDKWTKPAAPPSFTATHISTSQINLSWTDVAGESGYVIDRSPNGSTGWTQIATPGVGSTSFNNTTGLSAGTPYWYRIYAWNSGGNGDYSFANTSTFPAAPTLTNMDSLPGVGLRIEWNGVTGATNGYNVYGSTTQDGTYSYFGSTSNLYYEHSGYPLEAGTQYFCKVKASGVAGQSVFSSWMSTWTRPIAPTISSVQSLSTSTLRVNWGSVTSATSYKIYRSPNQGGTYVYKHTTSSLSWDNSDLAEGTKYHYKVSAVNSEGESVLSASADNWTRPTAPRIYAIDPLTTDSLWVIWGSVSSATTYKVLQSTSEAGPFTIREAACEETYFTDENLSPGTRYWYVIIASNPGGDSAEPEPLGNWTLSMPPCLNAIARNSNRIDLYWNDTADAELDYRLSYSTDGVEYDYLGSTPTDATFYSAVGLRPDTQYYFRVRTNINNSLSHYSNVAVSKTFPSSIFTETWDGVREGRYPATAYPDDTTSQVVGSDRFWIWTTDPDVQHSGFRQHGAAWNDQVGRFAPSSQQGAFTLISPIGGFDFTDSEALAAGFDLTIDDATAAYNQNFLVQIRCETDYSYGGSGIDIWFKADATSPTLNIQSTNSGSPSNTISASSALLETDEPLRLWVTAQFMRQTTSSLAVDYRVYSSDAPSSPLLTGTGMLDRMPHYLDRICLKLYTQAIGAFDDLELTTGTLDASQIELDPLAPGPSGEPKSTVSPGMYRNPIFPPPVFGGDGGQYFAGVCVYKWMGYYYLYNTGGGVPVWRSRNLVNWQRISSGALRLVPIATGPDAPGRPEMEWSPEIFYFNGTHYMYVSYDWYNSDPQYGTASRHYVFESKHPAQSFKGASTGVSLPNTINGNVFMNSDGTMYFLHSGRDGDDESEMIGVRYQTMSSPTQVDSGEMYFPGTNLNLGHYWYGHRNYVEGQFLSGFFGKLLLTYCGNSWWYDNYQTWAVTFDGFENHKPVNARQAVPLIVAEIPLNGNYTAPGESQAILGPDLQSIYTVYHMTDKFRSREDYEDGRWSQDRGESFRVLMLDRLIMNTQGDAELYPHRTPTFDEQPIPAPPDWEDFLTVYSSIQNPNPGVPKGWLDNGAGVWTMNFMTPPLLDYMVSDVPSMRGESYGGGVASQIEQEFDSSPNFAGEFNLKLVGNGELSNSRFGVIVAGQDESNYITITIDSELNQLFTDECVDNASQGSQQSAFSRGDWDHYQWHRMNVVKLGTELKVFMDGILVHTRNGVSLGARGKVGFFLQDCEADFAYAAVSDIAAQTAAQVWGIYK